MNATEVLLDRADKLARDLVMDAYDVRDGDQLLHGWVHVMRALSTAWDAVSSLPADDGRNPFTQAALIAGEIGRDAKLAIGTQPEPRTLQISRIVRECAQTISAELASGGSTWTMRADHVAQLRLGMLHVGYLTTHAVAANTARHAGQPTDHNPVALDVSHSLDRIRGVEQLLDALLHRRPQHQPTDRGVEFDKALTRLTRAAYQARNNAGVGTHLVLADIGRDLVGNVARLSILAARSGLIPSRDIATRLLPALQISANQWETTRRAWAGLLAPTDRPDPALAAAASQLQRTIREPEVADTSAITSSLTRALTVTAELALINHRAIANPDLTAPAGAVAAMTTEILERERNGNKRLETWLSMDAIDGPIPIKLPAILSADLNAQAHATYQAAIIARSAGHSLIDGRGVLPDLALHTGRSTPKHRDQDTPTRHEQRTAPRIG